MKSWWLGGAIKMEICLHSSSRMASESTREYTLRAWIQRITIEWPYVCQLDSGLCHTSKRTQSKHPIWRVLASSQGISSWTPLKPQYSNPNPNPLANQLWCWFLTPPTPLIILHILLAFLESLMPLKNWCLIHARCSKSSLNHSIRFCDSSFFKFKTEFYSISFF